MDCPEASGHPVAAENDVALSESTVLVWRLERDHHRLELLGVNGARHGEGPAPAVTHLERASGRHLTVLTYVPALVPLRIPEALEVSHGQGDLPAAGGILTGRRSPGRSSEAAHLGRRGGMKRDDGRGGPVSQKAERDGDGAGDGGSCGGNSSD